MTSFRRSLRRVFSAVSGSGKRAALARGAVALGFGLTLLVGGTAPAAEIEHGEAEQAPTGVVGDPTPARVEPQAPISPARVAAHTAQLPKGAAKPGSKPLVAADLANDLSKPAAGPGQSPGTPPAQSRGTAPSSVDANPGPRTRVTAPKTAKRTRLPLAPSAGEIRREIAARNGGPPTVNSGNPGTANATTSPPSAGARLQEQATTPPSQNPRWPTHVDYTAGPSGPAGGNTAAERKGAMIETTGPQQGVIRNQW